MGWTPVPGAGGQGRTALPSGDLCGCSAGGAGSRAGVHHVLGGTGTQVCSVPCSLGRSRDGASPVMQMRKPSPVGPRASQYRSSGSPESPASTPQSSEQPAASTHPPQGWPMERVSQGRPRAGDPKLEPTRPRWAPASVPSVSQSVTPLAPRIGRM